MQSRIGSLTEKIIDLTIGYFVAVAMQLVLYPIFNIQISLEQSFQVAALFTAVSLVRGYIIRRIFNSISEGKFKWPIQRRKNI